MTGTDGIDHLDFDVECDVSDQGQACDAPARWSITFHPCPGCGCDQHAEVLVCNAHTLRLLQQKKARCHCGSTLPIHSWKAIDQ